MESPQDAPWYEELCARKGAPLLTINADGCLAFEDGKIIFESTVESVKFGAAVRKECEEKIQKNISNKYKNSF